MVCAISGASEMPSRRGGAAGYPAGVARSMIVGMTSTSSTRSRTADPPPPPPRERDEEEEDEEEGGGEKVEEEVEGEVEEEGEEERAGARMIRGTRAASSKLVNFSLS
jgi:hypothetical protein